MDALLANRRIRLEPAPARPPATDPLEVLFVGHAPGAARPERLAEAAWAELRRFGVDLDGLRAEVDERARAEEGDAATLADLAGGASVRAALADRDALTDASARRLADVELSVDTLRRLVDDDVGAARAALAQVIERATALSAFAADADVVELERVARDGERDELLALAVGDAGRDALDALHRAGDLVVARLVARAHADDLAAALVRLVTRDVSTARAIVVDLLGRGIRARVLDVPLPITTLGEFRAVFPESDTLAVRDVASSSPVVGPHAWLPRAVEDYFDAGGERLWVVVLPEDLGARAFLPSPAPIERRGDDRASGLEHLLALDDVGLVACPDLERLLVPPAAPDVPEFAPSPPEPRFLPLRSLLRRAPAPLVERPIERVDLVGWGDALRDVAGFLARHRPDVQALLTLPLGTEVVDGRPAVDVDALTTFDRLRALRGADADRRRRAVQVVFPYLRDARARLATPTGRLAGAIHLRARTEGAWRSIAARPLGGRAVAFPRVDVAEAARLRERHDVGVLTSDRDVLLLDDERSASVEFARSAEAVRFWGFLRRQLERLGRVGLFDVDPRDPRPRLAIEQFLARLHAAGAFDGRLPEDAYSVRRHDDGESRVVFEIELRLAFPIERLHLALVNTSGAWRVEGAP